jgi:hypothetical protein
MGKLINQIKHLSYAEQCRALLRFSVDSDISELSIEINGITYELDKNVFYLIESLADEVEFLKNNMSDNGGVG